MDGILYKADGVPSDYDMRDGVDPIGEKLPTDPTAQSHRLREFDLAGRVFVVTGGAQGLALAMAEALVEAGGTVHCLDRLKKPDEEFIAAQKRASPDFGGSLHYDRIDVRDTANLDKVILVASLLEKIDSMD